MSKRNTLPCISFFHGLLTTIMAVVVVIGRQCPIKYTIRWSFHFLYSYIKKIYWSIIISVQMFNFSLAFWYEFWKYILYYQEIAGNIQSKESIFSGTRYSLLQYDLMIKPEIMVIWTKNHLLLCVLVYNCTCLSFLCVPFSCPAKRAALLFLTFYLKIAVLGYYIMLNFVFSPSYT